MAEGAGRSSRARTLAVSALAFVALGGLVSLYGPLFPALRERFGLGFDQVGAAVSAHFFGALAAVVVCGELVRRSGYRPVLAAGAGLMALGLGGLVLAPTWAAFLLCVAAAGVGFGLVQVAVNLLVARTFAGRAAPALNLINAAFGAGATLLPLLNAAAGARLEPPALALAALALVVLLTVPSVRAVPAPPPVRGASEPVPWGALAAFVVLYFGYVSAEVGVTSWSTEHLTPALGAETAAAVPGLYWGVLTVGRLLAVPVSARVRPGRLLLVGLGLALVGLAGTSYAPIAPLMYGITGLGLAPTFAVGLAWLTERMPRRAEQVSPAVFAAASIGPIATAPLVGVGLERFGPSAVPVALAGFAALAMLAVVWLLRRS